MENTEITQESIFTNAGEHRLHLRRFYTNPKGQPVWMVHGSIENGHIFYSNSGKGLAPFLAAQGYDVFVADLRGRGKSTPPIDSSSKWGLKENLKEDFPAYIEKIRELKGNQPQHWMAHSWGGVMQLAFLARYTSPAEVASLTFFGTKRRIGIFSLTKFLKVDLVWNHFSKLLVKKYGYLPAKKFNIGSDNESRRSHSETHHWVVAKKWLDWHDNFDYGKALQEKELPPALYLTGANDKELGNPADVRELMLETKSANAKMQVVGKKEGYLHDYDHINLLTHPDAPKDHFREIIEWLKKFR